jgi:hypothetical protein
MFTAIPATPTHRAAPDALHHRRAAGTHLNIDLVFPIRDEISAWLMCLKAESLCEAGIISDNELDAVIERAAAAIGPPEKSDEGTATYEAFVLLSHAYCPARGARTTRRSPPSATGWRRHVSFHSC